MRFVILAIMTFTFVIQAQAAGTSRRAWVIPRCTNVFIRPAAQVLTFRRGANDNFVNRSKDNPFALVTNGVIESETGWQRVGSLKLGFVRPSDMVNSFQEKAGNLMRYAQYQNQRSFLTAFLSRMKLETSEMGSPLTVQDHEYLVLQWDEFSSAFHRLPKDDQQ